MKIENNTTLKALIDLRLALETQVDDFLSNMDNDEVDTDRLEYFTVNVPTIDGGETVHKISWNAQIFNELERALRECIITEAEDDFTPLVNVKQHDGTTKLSNIFVYDPINDRVVETIDYTQIDCDVEPIELASAHAQLMYRQQEAVVCEYCDDENYVKRWYIHSAVGLGKMTVRMIEKQIEKHITYIWE